MRKYLIFAVTLIAVSTMAGLAYCEERPDETALRTFEGTVTSVDQAGSTLAVSGGEEMVFPITARTQFKNDVYETQLSKLKAGDYVHVQYYRDASGTIKTMRVEVDYAKNDANKGWDDSALYKDGSQW